MDTNYTKLSKVYLISIDTGSKKHWERRTNGEIYAIDCLKTAISRVKVIGKKYINNTSSCWLDISNGTICVYECDTSKTYSDRMNIVYVAKYKDGKLVYEGNPN